MDYIKSSADVLAASTALSGLVLVFLGSVVSGFGQTPAEDQPAVKTTFLIRGWLSFVTFAVSLSSAVAAALGEELRSHCLGAWGLWLLLAGFALTLLLALLSVLEIK